MINTVCTANDLTLNLHLDWSLDLCRNYHRGSPDLADFSCQKQPGKGGAHSRAR